jgi:phosphoenolpyruvate-protein kinase (PTS system EI component)
VCNNECPHCEAGQGANDTSGYHEIAHEVNRLAEEFSKINAQVKQSAARKGRSRDGDEPKWFRSHNSLLRKQEVAAHAIAVVEERARWLEVRQ